MTRKHTPRRRITPLPPRGLRPRLTRDQLLDLGLAHVVNLDLIARGEAGEPMLWDPSEWFHGPFGFVIERPIAYPSLIPYRGALGIFGVPANVLDDVGHNGSPHA